MIITLVGLALILMSVMAMVRSFDTSLSMAGNLAFKRDLVNQGERAMVKAKAVFATGDLAAPGARLDNSQSNNYSATALPSDTHGIPIALINDAAFQSLGMTGADISDSTSGVRIRYVIDRLCTATGDFSASSCVAANVMTTTGGSGSKQAKNMGTPQPVYRISVRVTGPRNTQAYLQTTMTN